MINSLDNLKTSIRKNKPYFIVIAVFIAFIFFLSSKTIVPSSEPLKSTPLNEVQKKENLSITLIDRQYNPKSGLVRFFIKIENKDSKTYFNLDSVLREKSDPIKDIKTYNFKLDNEYYSIFAKIPNKDWSVLSLSIGNKSTDTTDNIDVESIINTESSSNESQKEFETNEDIINSLDYIKFYSDRRDIKENKKLKENSVAENLSDVSEIEIKNLKEKIKTIDENIKKININVSNLEETNKELDASKKYKTETELAITDTDINSNNSQIKALKEKENQLLNSKKEITDKISKLDMKKKDLGK